MRKPDNARVTALPPIAEIPSLSDRLLRVPDLTLPTEPDFETLPKLDIVDRAPLLLVIDVQRGFINPETAHLPALIQPLQYLYRHVVATRFYNPPGSFFRTVLKWNRFAAGSDEISLAFAPRPDALILDKSRYTALDGTLRQTLHDWGVERVDVCGIDTDACVLKTAVDLLEAGYIPRVLSRLCASTAGPNIHADALRILTRTLGSSQVIS